MKRSSILLLIFLTACTPTSVYRHRFYVQCHDASWNPKQCKMLWLQKQETHRAQAAATAALVFSTMPRSSR